MSRSLAEIVDAVRAGETPEVDELFYAVAVLDRLLVQAGEDVYAVVVDNDRPWLAPLLEAFTDRLGLARKADPKRWLGPMNDPRCPNYQAWYRDLLETRRRLLH